MNNASLHDRTMQIADAGSQQRCDAVLERMHTHRGAAAAALEQLLDDDPGCVLRWDEVLDVAAGNGNATPPRAAARG
jgi:hypothetical protein